MKTPWCLFLLQENGLPDPSCLSRDARKLNVILAKKWDVPSKKVMFPLEEPPEFTSLLGGSSTAFRRGLKGLSGDTEPGVFWGCWSFSSCLIASVVLEGPCRGSLSGYC